MKMEQSVPKRRHIKLRRRIAQKKAYNKDGDDNDNNNANNNNIGTWQKYCP